MTEKLSVNQWRDNPDIADVEWFTGHKSDSGLEGQMLGCFVVCVVVFKTGKTVCGLSQYHDGKGPDGEYVPIPHEGDTIKPSDVNRHYLDHWAPKFYEMPFMQQVDKAYQDALRKAAQTSAKPPL